MDFASLEHDLKAAAAALIERRRRRRRGIRVSAAVVLIAFAAVGAAAAAVRVLGGPAPDSVREDIRAVDRGLPADLRLNPDVLNARAVAATESSTLYAAFLKRGGYCTEIVTENERNRGATCYVASDLEQNALSITVPSDDDSAPSAPVTIGGRVNRDGVDSLELRYGPDGRTDQVPLGEDGFFIFDVPADHRALARESQLELTARDSSGALIAAGSVPADWASPAVPDDSTPLFVSTRSDADNLTKVFGIDGYVNIARAVTLELRYPDGEVVSIPFDEQGSFHYEMPESRVDDLMQPGLLTALDSNRQPLVQQPVAAVAYWRARERGR